MRLFTFGSRIATRVWLLLMIIYLISMVFVVVILFKNFRIDLLESSERDLNHRLELVQQDQKQFITEVEQNISVLSLSPQVKNFANGHLNHEELDSSSRILVEQLFSAFLDTYSEYFQVRLLDINTGMELIRLNTNGAKVEVVEEEGLQSKANRNYFLKAKEFDSGQFYFSIYDLNQEHGELSKPYIKTMRVATPIMDSKGAKSVLLVININVANWLDQLEKYQHPNELLYLIDDKGNFIFHPDDSRTFAELKSKDGFSLSDFEKDLITLKSDDIPGFKELSNQDVPYLCLSRNHSFGKVLPRQVKLVGALNKEALFEKGNKEFKSTILKVVIAIVLGLLLLRWVAQIFVKPVKDLEVQISSYVPGNPIETLAYKGNDELGNLAQSFWKLTEKINQQIDQLNDARTKVEESIASKEEFLGNMSHEIRTPLNSIRGMINVLSDKGHTAEQKPILDAIKYSSGYLDALISDVLDYQKIQEGNLKLNTGIVAPEEIARNLYMSHLLTAESMNIDLNYDVSPSVPGFINTDKIRLAQILNNLLTNALKHSKNGKVEMNIDWKDNCLVAEISDTGQGIPKKELENIFEPYYQIDQGKEKRSGVGLGLSIVDHLVQLFRGSIEIESIPGEGSSFKVSIPAEIAVQEEKPKLEKQLSEHELRILYVDDIELNRITAQHLFESVGMELHCVDSCKQAIERINENSFDVILMDLRMPEVDGFECILQLQKMNVGVPIIAVSANLGQEELNRLGSLGIENWIEKPIDIHSLTSLIIELSSSQNSRIYKHLLSVYCNENPDLLGRLVLRFQDLLRDCKTELEGFLQNPSKEQETTIADINHRLKPSLKMFDQYFQFQRIQENEGQSIEALLHAISHLETFLIEFRKEFDI